MTSEFNFESELDDQPKIQSKKTLKAEVNESTTRKRKKVTVDDLHPMIPFRFNLPQKYEKSSRRCNVLIASDFFSFLSLKLTASLTLAKTVSRAGNRSRAHHQSCARPWGSFLFPGSERRGYRWYLKYRQLFLLIGLVCKFSHTLYARSSKLEVGMITTLKAVEKTSDQCPVAVQIVANFGYSLRKRIIAMKIVPKRSSTFLAP